MWPFSRRALSICAIAFSLTASSAALADNASTAEQLFQAGLEAMKKNDYDTACEAFAGSNRADPSPGTQINLAICLEKQKKWASAWAYYRSAASLAEQRGQSERVTLATKEAERVKPQIHYVVISVKPPVPEGLLVKKDGEEVTTTLGGKEIPLPFDPGEHTIEVTAKGKRPFTTKLKTVDAPGTERFEVPPLEDAPETTGPGGTPPGVPGGTPVVVTTDGSGQRTVGIVVGGAGVLAGLAALGVYILARSEASKGREFRQQANEHREAGRINDADRVNGTADSRFSAADNNRLIAIICAAGGAVLLGVGGVLYFTAPKGSAGATGKPRVLPELAPGYAGLSAGMSF